MSNRDARSVANLATLSFQTPLATPPPPKKANSDKSSDFLDKLSRVSVIAGTAATARDQYARSSFSASALFSERPFS